MWCELLLIFSELLHALIALGSFSLPTAAAPAPAPSLAHLLLLLLLLPLASLPFSSFTLLSHNLIFSMPHLASDNISGVVERNIIWLRFGLNASNGGDVRKFTGVNIGSNELRNYKAIPPKKKKKNSLLVNNPFTPSFSYSPHHRSYAPANAFDSRPLTLSSNVLSSMMAPPCPAMKCIHGSIDAMHRTLPLPMPLPMLLCCSCWSLLPQQMAHWSPQAPPRSYADRTLNGHKMTTTMSDDDTSLQQQQWLKTRMSMQYRL